MTTARRTQQQRRDQAETALLNAAAELAVEHGVRSLTLARVGERAGYSRGIVTILDRRLLERKSCECYRTIRQEYDRLLPGSFTK